MSRRDPAGPMVIALDGPAAAGKGTLGRRLARHYGFAYLDTGALYRAVALALLRAGADLDDMDAAVAAARSLRTQDLEDPDLRGDETAKAASRISARTEVRQALLQYQRDFAANPPPPAKGAVIDGRDIGTVVCPDASRKIFVTASREARARRRHAELKERGLETNLEQVMSEMAERDARDEQRALSPLKPAPDAYLLDTTNLDIDAAFARAKAYVDA